MEALFSVMSVIISFIESKNVLFRTVFVNHTCYFGNNVIMFLFIIHFYELGKFMQVIKSLFLVTIDSILTSFQYDRCPVTSLLYLRMGHLVIAKEFLGNSTRKRLLFWFFLSMLLHNDQGFLEQAVVMGCHMDRVFCLNFTCENLIVL